MKTILVPIPDNANTDKIIKTLDLFCKKEEDKIILMHIKSIPASAAILETMSGTADDMIEEASKIEEEGFKKSAEQIKNAGFDIETSAPIGFFDQEFVTQANERNPSLVIMFTAGSHGVIQDIFGTNTSHVFQKLNSPVVIVPQMVEFDELESATVCLHMENEDLNVLGKVFDLSDHLNIKLNFVNIDNNFQLDIINDDLVFNKINKLFPGKVEEVVHRKSENIGVALEDFSNETGTDMLVLFTTRRGLIERLFHKSITRDLALHSQKPLLIYHY